MSNGNKQTVEQQNRRWQLQRAATAIEAVVLQVALTNSVEGVPERFRIEAESMSLIMKSSTSKDKWIVLVKGRKVLSRQFNKYAKAMTRLTQC